MGRYARTEVRLALMTLIAISLPAHAVEPAPADKWTFALPAVPVGPASTGR